MSKAKKDVTAIDYDKMCDYLYSQDVKYPFISATERKELDELEKGDIGAIFPNVFLSEETKTAYIKMINSMEYDEEEVAPKPEADQEKLIEALDAPKESEPVAKKPRTAVKNDKEFKTEPAKDETKIEEDVFSSGNHLTGNKVEA